MSKVRLVRIPIIKFREWLERDFTCSDETEAIPEINTGKTEVVPVYTEEEIIEKTLRTIRELK